MQHGLGVQPIVVFVHTDLTLPRALMGSSTSYRNSNLLGLSHASSTACPKSVAPAPPRPWWLQIVAASAPASVCACVYVFLCVFMCVCVRACLRVCMCVCVRACEHAHACAFV